MLAIAVLAANITLTANTIHSAAKHVWLQKNGCRKRQGCLAHRLLILGFFAFGATIDCFGFRGGAQKMRGNSAVVVRKMVVGRGGDGGEGRWTTGRNLLALVRGVAGLMRRGGSLDSSTHRRARLHLMRLKPTLSPLKELSSPYVNVGHP